MSSYLVFSLKEKESRKFRDVTSYCSTSDQYQVINDAIDVPYNGYGDDEDEPSDARAKLTSEKISAIKRYIKEEREDLERKMETYRQTNNPSWDLFTTAQDYVKMIEDVNYLDVWCDTLSNIVEDINTSDGFYEGVYIHRD